MKVAYTKRFLKELADVPARERAQIEAFVFDELPAAGSIGGTRKLEKLAGYTRFYKARFGNWRVGFQLEADTLVIERVLDRKEIYKFFP